MLPLYAKNSFDQVLINELGLNVNNITSTYVKAMKPADKIASDNAPFLIKKFFLHFSEINKNFRKLYQSKVYNYCTDISSKNTLKSCCSNKKANVQPNRKL